MNLKLQKVLTNLFFTLALLIFFEIINSAFLPAIVSQNFRLAFDVLLILYLGLKVETPYLPLLILLIQFIHSGFTVQGWAHGTFTGVIMCIVIGYVRDLLQFSSFLATIVVSELFQILWFLLISFLFYIQTDQFTMEWSKISNFLIGSLSLSILSPLLFKILDKIWAGRAGSSLEAQG